MGWSPLRRIVLPVLSFALVVSGALSGPAWADPPAEPPVGPVVRPDWVSASVTARSLGVRVEVLSERSETVQVWVNPDGSVTQDTATGQVRFRDDKAAEGWRDIDTDLVRSAEGITAAALPSKTVLGTGLADVVTVDAGGPGELALALPGVVLPEPKLDGPRATYADVLPGVDVSVEVRSSGFELLWVVKTPAAARELGRRFGTTAGVVLPTLVRSKGVVAPVGVDGSVEVRDVRGKRLGRFGSPVMWDSAAKIPGERGQSKKVDFQVASKAQGRGRGVGVAADAGWLTDPARVFPIVIDPTYATDSGLPVFDTFVQQGFTTDQSASAELKLGNNGSGQVARSFMNFNASLFKGRQVTASTLSLFESWSYNCTAKPFSAWDAGLASTSSRWTAQPSIGAKRATQTAAAGYSSSCPAARVQIDMTAQAQAWSSTSAAQVGVMLRADDEADVVSWKRFHSSEGQWKPVISVTYNRPPAVPAAPSVQGLVSAATQAGTKKFVGSTQPAVSVVVSDPDANTARASFAVFSSATSTASPVTLCSSGYVASGGTASCTPSGGLLVDNTTVWIRATVTDGVGAWSGWGPAVEVRIATSAPMTPTISCPTANGSWGNTVKAAETCVINMPVDPAKATSAPTKVRWQVGTGSWQEITKTQPSPTSANSHGVTLGGTAGSHTLKAQTVSPTGKVSTIATYQFGYGLGAATLNSPSTRAVTTTHGVLPVSVMAPPKGVATGVTGVMQWRIKGSPDTAWTDTGTPANAPQVGNATSYAASFDTNLLVGLSDGANVTVPERTPIVVQVRVKLVYAGVGTSYTPAAEVLRVPHAFGGSFPTTNAGQGQVALWTGEFQFDQTDAQLTTPSGGLSVSRIHSTFAHSGGVFGPGWETSLDTVSGGVESGELVDQTLLDGSIVLTFPDGTSLSFFKAGAGRRTTAQVATGTYVPITPDGAETGLRVEVSATEVNVKNDFGTSTRYGFATASTATTAAVFRVTGVTTDLGGGGFTYRADGKVQYLTDAPAAGVPACPATGSATGCRRLEVIYATTKTATTSTAGDFAGQVKQINALSNGETHPLSTYKYNNDGLLVSQTDALTGLTTTYTWTGTVSQPRIATVTPAGVAPVIYTYTSDGKLFKVTRPTPATAGGGTTQLAAFGYNLTPASIPGLSGTLAQFGDYQLTRSATTAFAVFGPDAPISTIPASTDTATWRRAGVWATDPEGRTVHAGGWALDGWQLTANNYDIYDNVVQAWGTRATEAITKGQISDIDSAATTTVFAPEVRNAQDEIVTFGGWQVTDTYSPARMVLVPATGVEELVRSRTHTDYDEGAPTSGLGVPTTITVTAERPDATVVESISTQWLGYEPLNPGDPSGWDLGTATSTTLDMNGNNTPDAGDLVNRTRYDQQGRIIEQRKPGSTGTDAATRTTAYWAYTTAAPGVCETTDPTQAGFLCKVGPAAQPGGTTMPVTTTSGYRWDGRPTTQTETSGTATRTTTITYDPATARPTTTTVNVDHAAMPESIPVPAMSVLYDPATGQISGTSSTAGSTATTYDTWGRPITYTNAPTGAIPDTTTTVYGPTGAVASITTPTSTTTYTLNGPDAAGAQETRGLPTQVTVTASGFTATATAAYNSQGDLTLEKLPGNINRRNTYAITGELLDQSYNGDLTTPDGVEHDQPWIAWSQRTNPAGQITREWTPEGAALTGALPGTPATWADLNYGYDKAGRLTTVTDLSAPTLNAPQTCTLRTYGFDQRGNRTTQSTTTAPVNNPCPTTGGSTTTRTYDTADRPLTGANGQGNYTYDPLGRQTTIPTTDAPHPANGSITVEYFDTDTARRIQQGTTTTQFELDGAGRRATQTIYNDSTTPSSTATNHYINRGDNPGWLTITTGGNTFTSIYTQLLSRGLGLTITNTPDGTQGELPITTPRGDIAATINLSNSTSAAVGLESFTRYTEHGSPVSTQPSGTRGAAANGYGWLGTHQRSTTGQGLIEMGLRLYNISTGTFSSKDSIYGGTETDYGYPNDPINQLDITGTKSVDQRYVRAVRRVCASVIYPGGCLRYAYRYETMEVVTVRYTRTEAVDMAYRKASSNSGWMTSLNAAFFVITIFAPVAGGILSVAGIITGVVTAALDVDDLAAAGRSNGYIVQCTRFVTVRETRCKGQYM